jgi:hypothetical protein
MSKGVLISRDLAVRTKDLVDGINTPGIRTPDKSILSSFAGYISPVELSAEWNNDDGNGWKAKCKRLYYRTETGEYHPHDNDNSETELFYPLSLDKPKGSTGTRAFAVYRGRWEVVAFGEVGESAAKELFPAVVYKKSENETYIICPGGRDEERSVKTVHVIHIENRTVSTSKFGSLPMAMSNFSAVIADNGYGSPILVCAPGEVESGTKYPVQRYDFVTEEWVKSDTNQSLAGCPSYMKDGKMIIAGGQSAYYVSTPKALAGGGGTGAIQQYGHNASPIWEIEPVAGTLELKTPIRLFRDGNGDESPEVNKQKRFLKQNFTGIRYEHSENGKPVEFIAVGGLEQLGYQPNAVVSYAMDSLGALLDCEHNTEASLYGGCEIFPDTPIPLGECCSVRIGNNLVCFGGRYRLDDDVIATEQDENGNRIILYKKGEFMPHKRAWILNLDTKKWTNDFVPEIPTPRWNAALSEVVTVKEDILDNEGKPTGEKKDVHKVYLIGGRIDNRTVEKVVPQVPQVPYYKLVTKKGLTSSIDVYNIDTNKWETFPSL